MEKLEQDFYIDQSQETETEDIEKIRDSFFDILLVENVLKNYELDMSTLGFSSQQQQEFVSALNNLELEDQKKVLSFPYEQRMIYFKNQLEEINSGTMSVDQFVEELLEFANANGFTIGFHMTSQAISKGLNRDKRVTWEVKGTQKDHRDGDITMAYYSKHYRHLYAHKPYKYIYVVRSADAHRTDGNWFRAPSLSIVSEIPIDASTLQQRMEEEVKNSLKQKKEEHAT